MKQQRSLILILTLLISSLLIGFGEISPAVQAAPKPPAESPATVTPCTPEWNTVPAPRVGSSEAIFSGVQAFASNNVWLAGSAGIAENGRALLSHWTGNGWEVISPTISGSTASYLVDIDAASTSNMWAVGSYRPNPDSQRTLTLHWDGSTWQRVDSPNPGSGNNYLSTVTVVAANDAWTIGSRIDAGVEHSLILHWNGTAWNEVASPNVGAGMNTLLEVSATASNDVWAVGYSGEAQTRRTLILHWNGTSWLVMPSPNIGERTNELRAVVALSSTDVWAVGRYFGDDSEYPLYLHWDGSVWNVVTGAAVRGGALNDLAARSADDIWAVGSKGQQVNVHWNGSSWSNGSNPEIPSYASNLLAVDTVSASEVWAVGYSDIYGGYYPLIQRYTCLTTDFSDVPTSYVFYPDIKYLARQGVVNGYANGDGSYRFEPAASTTRAQFAKIAVLAFGIPAYTPTTPTFSDVPSNNFFFSYVEAANHAGVITGYTSNTFRPGQNITRAQVAKIVVLAKGFRLFTPNGATFADVPVGSFFYPYVETLNSRHIISGGACGSNLCFRPDDPITRGELSKVTGRAIQSY